MFTGCIQGLQRGWSLPGAELRGGGPMAAYAQGVQQVWEFVKGFRTGRSWGWLGDEFGEAAGDGWPRRLGWALAGRRSGRRARAAEGSGAGEGWERGSRLRGSGEAVGWRTRPRDWAWSRSRQRATAQRGRRLTDGRARLRPEEGRHRAAERTGSRGYRDRASGSSHGSPSALTEGLAAHGSAVGEFHARGPRPLRRADDERPGGERSRQLRSRSPYLPEAPSATTAQTTTPQRLPRWGRSGTNRRSPPRAYRR